MNRDSAHEEDDVPAKGYERDPRTAARTAASFTRHQ
jgi:hypothetical protein